MFTRRRASCVAIALAIVTFALSSVVDADNTGKSVGCPDGPTPWLLPPANEMIGQKFSDVLDLLRMRWHAEDRGALFDSQTDLPHVAYGQRSARAWAGMTCRDAECWYIYSSARS